jgi:hypothetical protein
MKLSRKRREPTTDELWLLLGQVLELSLATHRDRNLRLTRIYISQARKLGKQLARKESDETTA